MKYAACCESQIQLMALLNYAYNVLGEEDECDLFISEVRLESDEQWRRIVESKVFSNVYRWRYRLLGETPKILSVIGHLLKDLFPGFYLRYIIREKFCAGKYDYVVSSSVNLATQLLGMSIPRVKLIAIDDGMGSYLATYKKDLFTSPMKGAAGKKNLIPICLYLNNIDFYVGMNDTYVKGLPRIDCWSERYASIFNEIFPIEHVTVYDIKKMIYLAEPMQEFLRGGYKKSFFDKKILEDLEKYYKYIVVRHHPRDIYTEKSKEIYTKINGASLDDTGSSWEALCAKKITENHVLISVYSTAQFIPKMIYDKEPYIVFTFRLYEDLVDEVRDQGELTAQWIIESYRDKSKIFIPDTIDELDAIIADLKI